VELVLSFLPLSNDQAELRWFLDGRQVAQATYDLPLSPVGVEGVSVIGGTGGFVGIVDEVGVYAYAEDGQPSADPHVFRRSVEEELGRDLVFAEGFDTSTTPQEFRSEREAIITEAGALVLPAGSHLDLPPVPLETDASTVSLALGTELAGELELLLLAEDDTVLATIPVHRVAPEPAADDAEAGPDDDARGNEEVAEDAADGAGNDDDTEQPYLVPDDGALVFSVAYDDGRLVIASSASEDARPAVPADTRLVRVRLRNAAEDDDGAARLDSVVVAKDRPAPSEQDPIPLAKEQAGPSVET
jgi:hypothetical protein